MCPYFNASLVFTVTGTVFVLLAAAGVLTGWVLCRKVWNSSSWIIRRCEDPFFFWLSVILYSVLGLIFIFHRNIF